MQKKNENKKNKKVVVVAAMALLLALVGISGGETYAKYLSSQTDDASATVAKWGYVVSAKADGLFGEKYGTAQNKTQISDSGVNVVSTSGNVVAPGTEGKMTFSIIGDAQVLSKATLNLDVDDLNLNTTQFDNYKPLNWKLVVTKKVSVNDANPTVTTLTSVSEINNYENTFNTALNVVNANTYVDYKFELSWEWLFEDNNVAEKDLKDTVFGGLMYNGGVEGAQYTHSNDKTYEALTGSVFETTVNVSLSVQQIQTA